MVTVDLNYTRDYDSVTKRVKCKYEYGWIIILVCGNDWGAKETSHVTVKITKQLIGKIDGVGLWLTSTMYLFKYKYHIGHVRN